MSALRLSARQLASLILLFSAFTWLAPSLRMGLVGTEAADDAFSIFITALPDLFLLFVLGAAFLFYRSAEGRLRFISFDKIFAAFWLSNVLLGFALAMNLKLSLLGFRITYLPMIFYLVGRLFSMERNDVPEKMLRGIALTYAFFALAGIVIYFGFPVLGAEVAEANGFEQGKYFIPRMTSIVWTPVLFGTLMMIGLLYSAIQILLRGGWLNYALYALFSFCLFMSVSRGPILGGLIGLLALLAVFRSWKISLLLLAIFFAVSASISIGATGDLRMMKWIITSSGETAVLQENVSRVNRWEETWKDFKERPYGYGLGKAGAVAYRYLVNSNEPAAPWSTDGWLLKLACETGIYGVVTYLVLCAVFFFRAIRLLLKKKSVVASLALAVFLATNAQALVSNVYDFYPYIFIYWLLLGLAENERQSA